MKSQDLTRVVTMKNIHGIDERNAPDVEPGDVFIDDDSVLHVLTEDNLHVEDGWRLIAEGVSTVKF